MSEQVSEQISEQMPEQMSEQIASRNDVPVQAVPQTEKPQDKPNDVRKTLRKLKKQLNPDELKSLNSLPTRVPNFLVLGTQKGGTTWLHQNLKHHPQILLPGGRKELEFFSYYQKNLSSSGLSAYLSHFNGIGSTLSRPHLPKAIGEVTPSYFWSIKAARPWTIPPKHFNDDIPNSVLNVLGKNVKLIVSLRNPVDRAISAYMHHVKHDRINCKTQKILDVGKHYGIVDMGFYYQHFLAWLEKFDLSNFKVFTYEQDIKYNKEETIKSLCEFLEVNHQLYPVSVDINKFHNKGIEYRISEEGVYTVDAQSSNDFLVISRDEIKQLQEIYYEDVQALAKLIGLDVSIWNFSADYSPFSLEEAKA